MTKTRRQFLVNPVKVILNIFDVYFSASSHKQYLQTRLISYLSHQRLKVLEKSAGGKRSAFNELC